MTKTNETETDAIWAVKKNNQNVSLYVIYCSSKQRSHFLFPLSSEMLSAISRLFFFFFFLLLFWTFGFQVTFFWRVWQTEETLRQRNDVGFNFTLYWLPKELLQLYPPLRRVGCNSACQCSCASVRGTRHTATCYRMFLRFSYTGGCASFGKVSLCASVGFVGVFFFVRPLALSTSTSANVLDGFRFSDGQESIFLSRLFYCFTK